ncbi:hypothetical protein [Rubritalea tangerina]|uniref:DUF5666 domain-containing protein n=1 Tax=Rubritalea tangerina TaxID=430798 RepID=A0ABW4Z7J7_9BACT
MKLTKVMTIGAVLSLSYGLIACSEKQAEVKVEETEAKATGLEALVVAEEPAEAVSIAALRGAAKAGDEVTFTGKLIGNQTVLMDGRAIMVMGDPAKLTSCDLRPGDNCQMPWDVCCDDFDAIKANIVTVQVVDADGKPLKQGLRGVGGIQELSMVTVTGTVDAVSNADNMVVNAKSLFVKK